MEKEKKNFFTTKEGGLTIVFLVILAAFALVVWGALQDNGALLGTGLICMLAAMLYPPVNKVYTGIKKGNK